MNWPPVYAKLEAVIPLISPELKAKLLEIDAKHPRQWRSESGYQVLKMIIQNLDKSPEEIVLLVEAWAGEALDRKKREANEAAKPMTAEGSLNTSYEHS